MKFEEKLVILRKNKKMSQEKLADELNVSRQAVSKWESGSSYPEMDKLIQIAKIFDCTLDDLTNDKVSLENINSNKQKNPLNDILEELSNFIQKSINMFCDMNIKEIIKFIFFMFVVSIIILIFQLPIKALYIIGEQFFMRFGLTIGEILSGLWYFILGVVYFILSIVVFFYVYKIKYLDKYEQNKNKIDIQDEYLKKDTLEKDENNILKNKNTSFEIETKKVENTNKSWGILKLLGIIFIFFVKCVVFFFSIPFMFLYIFTIFGLLISIYLVCNGVIIIGIILLLLSMIILVTLFLELVFDFLFNKTIGNKKLLFITFLLGLILFGIGCGITAIEITDYQVKQELPSYYEMKTYTEEISFNDKFYLDHYNINYIIDDNLSNNLKIEINYYDEYSKPIIDIYDTYINIYFTNNDFNMQFIKNIIKDLKDKTIYNYYNLDSYKINVYTSERNIDILKNNYNNAYDLSEQHLDEINYYRNEIHNLEEKIRNLEDEKYNYEVTLEECEINLEDYKNRIKELLEY